MQLNKIIKLVISVAVVLAVALTVWYMSYPEQKESVEVGFSTSWSVEKADTGIKVQNEFTEGVIPVISFEYNNRNYTTIEGEKGLTIEIKKESFDDLLKYAENGNISQAHVVASGNRVYAVYVLIDNGQPYFSAEKLIDVDYSNYKIALEKGDESKNIVHFEQNLATTYIATILITIIASFVTWILLWAKRSPDFGKIS
ncbi:hypothetical protein KAI56_01515 [Candidatus Parcubacteria bacterium]|nr:hypothetical protein [Candidatus Parcubacteria bacterium]